MHERCRCDQLHVNMCVLERFHFLHVCSFAESLVREIRQDLPDNLESTQSLFGNER